MNKNININDTAQRRLKNRIKEEALPGAVYWHVFQETDQGRQILEDLVKTHYDIIMTQG